MTNLNALLKSTTPAVKQPKILTLDIETSLMEVYTFGIYEQNISINQIKTPSRVLCVATKWFGDKRIRIHSEDTDGHDEMIFKVWKELDEADIVVTYNGPAFDIKHLQREFQELGLTQPSPYRNVDLLRTTRSQFKFASNKLDYVSQKLNLGEKVSHTGLDLWKAVSFTDDKKAWNLFKKYCKHDVQLTEDLLVELGPWVKGFPNLSIYTNTLCCVRCASEVLFREGDHRTNAAVYERYQCETCSTWQYLTKNRKGMRAI